MQELRYILPSNLPSVLSISRIILVPIFWVLLRVHSNFAFPLYLVTCLTDFLDGKLARFLNSTSKKGAFLDDKVMNKLMDKLGQDLNSLIKKENTSYKEQQDIIRKIMMEHFTGKPATYFLMRYIRS